MVLQFVSRAVTRAGCVILLMGAGGILSQAKPVDSSDLDKVNKYIESQLSGNGKSDYQLRVTDGEISDNPSDSGSLKEVITSGRVEWQIKQEDQKKEGDWARGHMQLNLQQATDSSPSMLFGKVGAAIIVENPKKFYQSYLETVKKMVDKVNDLGIYRAELSSTELPNGTISAEISLKPFSDQAQSIHFLKLSGEFPDGENREMSLSGEGQFNIAADLIHQGQLSLTQVFYAFRDQRLPTDEEMAGLEAIFTKVVEFLDLEN